MNKNSVTWMVGGPAGYGINASGELFSRCFTRGGLNVFSYLEYPSLIRGGHNNYHIRVSKELIHSQVRSVDLLVCLNRETFDLHREKVSQGGGVLYDHEDFQIDEEHVPEGVSLYGVPFMKIVKDHEGIDVMRNTVALGASLALLKYPFQFLEALIVRQFKHKGEKVVELNVAVAKAGHDYVNEHYDTSTFVHDMDVVEGGKPQVLLSGNRAFSYGAMKAGCKLYAAYPMTPASSILSIFASHEEEMDIVVKQTEDELAAILYAIGGNYAGVRSMAATSGGGFALMVEALTMAGIAEVPLVIIEAQRPGPATGLPTWTGQGDLQFVLHAGHDDFPRLVMAPGDVHEAYEMVQHAFNWAERYHIPVIVMSDKYLSESLYSIPGFDSIDVPIDRGALVPDSDPALAERETVKECYPRYAFTETGVSPRTIPGMKGGYYVANSNEHDEHSDITEEAEDRVKMHSKRLKKMETIAAELPDPVIYGPEKADLTILGWGSTKGPVLEAMKWLEAEGISVNYVHPLYLKPFPAEFYKKVMKEAKQTLVLELTHEGQFEALIAEQTLMQPTHRLRSWDGRPFYPEDLVAHIQSLIQ